MSKCILMAITPIENIRPDSAGAARAAPNFARHAAGIARRRPGWWNRGVDVSGLLLELYGRIPPLARRAADLSARVLAITTREDSSLAAIADVVVAVPVQGSEQFGGLLFEQDPHAYKTMSRRHTNLEFRQ